MPRQSRQDRRQLRLALLCGHDPLPLPPGEGCADGGESHARFLAKLAFGFNVTVMLGLMEIGGYDANSDIQTETEKLFIQLGFVGVPIVCIIVTIILLLFFKFDKELPKMKAERKSKLEAAK